MATTSSPRRGSLGPLPPDLQGKLRMRAPRTPSQQPRPDPSRPPPMPRTPCPPRCDGGTGQTGHDRARYVPAYAYAIYDMDTATPPDYWPTSGRGDTRAIVYTHKWRQGDRHVGHPRHATSRPAVGLQKERSRSAPPSRRPTPRAGEVRPQSCTEGATPPLQRWFCWADLARARSAARLLSARPAARRLANRRACRDPSTTATGPESCFVARG